MDRVNNGTQGAGSSFVNGTILDAAWQQNLQEELIAIIEAEGDTPNGSLTNQISDIIARNKSIGVGQTWSDVSGSRVSGTTYTNNTGRPISVSVRFSSSPSSPTAILTIGGLVVSYFLGDSGNMDVTVCGIVPDGQAYVVTWNYGSYTWLELS